MNALPPASPATLGSPPSAQTVPPKKKVTADFEMFLKMLTAQMKNQDPSNPIESADYAVQLATFSGVEQQVKTNDLLTTLGEQMGAMGLAQLAGWVGMEARVAAAAYFDGTPITVFPQPTPDASSAVLIVTDGAGNEVSRQAIDLSGDPLDWAGVGSNSQPLPNGAYSFNVESYNSDGLISTDQAEIYTEISEAKFVGGEMVVVLASAVEIAASKVAALRKPGG